MGLPTANDNGMEKSTFRTEVEVLSLAERDVQALARLGKKPILKVCLRLSSILPKGFQAHDLQRRFSFLSILGFTCTILVTWEAELMWVTT